MNPEEFWFPWNPVKFRRKTQHLNPEQDGVYRRLIDYYMETGEQLPDNDNALARISGSSGEIWDRNREVIRAFFDPQDGFLFNKTCEEELSEMSARSRKRVIRARHAAHAKWKKASENKELSAMSIDQAESKQEKAMLGNATGQDKTGQDKEVSTHAPFGALPAGVELPSPPVSLKKPGADAQTGKEPGRAVAHVPSAPEIDMAFQRVWNAYPGRGKNGETGAAYKGAKVKALKTFTNIYKQEKESDREKLIFGILEGCGRYAAHLDRSGYCSAHCSTWLNARRWLDDYGSSPGAVTRPTSGYSIDSAVEIARADKTYDREGRAGRLAGLGIITEESDKGGLPALAGQASGALPAPRRDKGRDPSV